MADIPYVIVPKEPTEQMCRAGEECDGSSNSGPWLDGGYKPENVELIFKAMISASPSPITLEEIVEVLGTIAVYADDIPESWDDNHQVVTACGHFRKLRSLLSRLKEMSNPDCTLCGASVADPIPGSEQLCAKCTSRLDGEFGDVGNRIADAGFKEMEGDAK